MHEALDILAAKGVAVDALRIRAFPLSKAIADFVEEHEIVFVVEQNRDGQMRSLMTIDLEINPRRLESVRHYGGLSITAGFIVEAVLERLSVAAAPVLEPVT
jgi:2-oxoglutarate ferredoxin oxidoreductase subunit alpha